MKRILIVSSIAGVTLAAMAGCAQVKKTIAQPRATAVGSRFDRVGRVTLFAGEPCTPQIMFNFHATGPAVALGAPMRETKILTEAAMGNRRVHIRGKWRRGIGPDCRYVEVAMAELTR